MGRVDASGEYGGECELRHGVNRTRDTQRMEHALLFGLEETVSISSSTNATSLKVHLAMSAGASRRPRWSSGSVRFAPRHGARRRARSARGPRDPQADRDPRRRGRSRNTTSPWGSRSIRPPRVVHRSDRIVWNPAWVPPDAKWARDKAAGTGHPAQPDEDREDLLPGAGLTTSTARATRSHSARRRRTAACAWTRTKRATSRCC